jgi:hypothetical protein
MFKCVYIGLRINTKYRTQKALNLLTYVLSADHGRQLSGRVDDHGVDGGAVARGRRVGQRELLEVQAELADFENQTFVKVRLNQKTRN